MEYTETAEGYVYIPSACPLVPREVQLLSQVLEQQALFSNLLKHHKILKSIIQTIKRSKGGKKKERGMQEQLRVGYEIAMTMENSTGEKIWRILIFFPSMKIVILKILEYSFNIIISA